MGFFAWFLLFQDVEKYSSYPVYHSVYETYEIVEQFYDPTFKNHLAVAQVRGGLAFELANSVVLPFDCRDYASAVSNYAHIIYNLSRNHEEELATYNVSFGTYSLSSHSSSVNANSALCKWMS